MPQTTSRRSATTPPISTSKHKAASPALDNDMDDADLTTAVVGSPPVGGVSPPVVENALAASDGDDGANEEELGVGRGIGQPMDGMESSEEDLGALGSGFGGSNERTIPARGSDVGTSVTTGTLGTGSGSTEGPITRRRQSLETATIDKVVPSVTKVAQANLAEIAMETPDDILLIGSSSAAAPINVEASNSQPSGGSDSDTSPIALDPEAARARSEARGKGRAFSQSPPTNTPAWDPTYTRETASTDERPGLSRGGSSSSLTGMSEDVDGTYAQLLAMGFEPKVCEIALRKCIKQRKQNEEKRIQESEAQGQTGGSSPKVGKKPEIPPPVPPLLDVVVAYIVERTGDGDGIRGVELGASSPSAGRRQSSEPEVLHEPGAVRAPTKSILKNSNPSLASNPAASAANQMNFGSLGGVTSGFFSNFAQNMAALDHRHAATNTANAKEGSAGNSNPAGGSLFPRGLTQMGKQALTSFQGKVKPLLKQISSDLTDSSDDEPHNGTKDTRPTPAPPIQKSAFVIGGSSDSLQSNASRQTDETPLFTRRPLSSASNSSAPPQSPSRATPQPSPQRPLSAHNPTQEKHVRFSFPDLRSHVLAAQASALADGEVSPAPSSPMSVSSQNSLPPMSPSAWEGWDSPLDDGANPQHQLWSPATRMSESSDYFQNEYSNTTVGAGAASASPIVRPAPSASHVTTPDALLTFYQTRCLLRNEVMVESIASQIRKSVLPNETASLTAVTFEGQHGGDNEDGDGTRLSSLSFDGIVVGPRNVASLSDLLSTKYPLRKLSLSHVTLDDETLKPLLSALLAHDTVRELSLAHAKKVRGPSLKHLAVYVKKATSLRTLDVTGLPFDQRSVSFLAHALKEGAALETMRMDQCDMSPSLLSIFASGIADSRLTSLSLRGNAKLFRDSGSALSLLLGPGSSSGANGVPLSVITTSTYIVRGLRVLDLGDNAIGRSFTAFPRALKHNQRLEELYLSNSRALDSDSIAELADALKTNNALRVLDLSGASLDKNNQLEAVTALKDALTHNKSLETLNLANTELTSEGAIALAESLPLTRSLRRLDLTHNPLELAGVMAISVSMKMNKGIVALDVAPVLKKYVVPGMDRYDDDPDLAHFLNDIDMYCHRNLEIRTAEPLTPTALHSASPISPPPRAALASGEIDTERLANDMITAADVATVLLEMIAAGGDAEVLQQLYDQTKSFQGVLENLVSQTTAKLNEDVMMRILSTNDVLLAAIDAYTQHLTTPPPSSRPSRGATPSPARPKSTVEASSQPSSSSSRPSTWHGGAQLPIQPPSESSLKHKRDLSLSNLSDLDLLESIGDDMGHVGKGDGLHVRPQPSSRMNSELDDQMKEIDAFLEDQV